MSSDMERIATNAGKPTRRTHKGREFLVTSATLIVPGVLNGSQGALYYPPEEISRDPQRWNGVPVTVGHPTRNGTHVSGRDPDVLEEVGIGHVYRATANGTLTAEAWIDVDATRNYDRKNGTAILARLESGEKVELSTGLFTDNEPTPGTYNGRAYTHVARNYRPDHLALLHDQRGACSVTDGCGFGVNADVDNAFCPTGAGGGVDPSCAPGESSSSGDSSSGRVAAWGKLLSGIDSGDVHEGNYQEKAETLAQSIPKAELRPFLESIGIAERPTSGKHAARLMVRQLAQMVEDSRRGTLNAEGGQWVTTDDGNRLFLSDDGALQTGPGGKSVSGGKGKRGGKLTITKAAKALAKKGYTLEGTAEYDLKAKQARYKVKKPDGKTSVMTSGEIKALIGNADTTPPAVDSLLSELDGLIGVNVAGQVRSKVTGWFKRLGAGTGKGEAHEAAQSGAMTLDDDDRRLGADAAAQFASAGHNPASWVADEAIWERAKAAAAKFEGADDYYAVVAHIYRRMGGEVNEMTENEFESDEQRRAFFGLMGDDDEGGSIQRDKDGKVRLTYKEDLETVAPAQPGGQPRKVAVLKDGNGRVVFRSEPRDTVGDAKHEANLWATEELKQRRQSEKATPPKGAKDGDKVWKGKVISAREANDLKKQGYIKHFDEVGVVKGGKVVFNQAADTEEITMAFDKKQAVTFLTANCDCWKGREATLNKLSDEELQGIQNHVAREIAERQKTAAVVNTFTKGIKLGAATLTVNAEGQAVVRNADGEECAPDDVKCLEMMKAKEKAPPPVPAANQAKPQTEAEWFATAPPTIQAAVRNAMAVERAEREQLADRLTANAAADQKDTLKKFLLSKPLDELRQLATLVAPAANQHNPFAQAAPAYTVPHYLGAATPVALNAHAGQELETLDLPVMNWDTAKN